ncbi:hypothetical protein SDC9_162379 [bioreactor metagenome]|uniref:Uncharacterized protein n=1 Tax=bioreactor metagenome TaxID=1076179 RepID=A0A645FM78_9ZZZZ
MPPGRHGQSPSAPAGSRPSRRQPAHRRDPPPGRARLRWRPAPAQQHSRTCRPASSPEPAPRRHGHPRRSGRRPCRLLRAGQRDDPRLPLSPPADSGTRTGPVLRYRRRCVPPCHGPFLHRSVPRSGRRQRPRGTESVTQESHGESAAGRA